MVTSSLRRNLSCAIAFVCIPVCGAFAEQHPGGVPQLSSRPGATFTLYLDVAGFNYNGRWGDRANLHDFEPGSSLALGNVASNGTFSANDQTEIRTIWATMEQAYRSFNVNVTTVDPAVAVGQASTDATRQAYYESQQDVLHTIVGPYSNDWAAGISSGTPLGLSNTVIFIPPALEHRYFSPHSNFVFTDSSFTNTGNPVADGTYVGIIASHEGGHAFGLVHQADIKNNFTVVEEYGKGDAATGPGSYAPIMGSSLNHQRYAWRSGPAAEGPLVELPQNDVATMFSNTIDTGYTDSGFGHTFATASALPLSGHNVNPAAASGVITPTGTTDIYQDGRVAANPSGASNYTKDLFQFASDGLTPISLTAHDGTDLLTPGVADPGTTLRSVLKIYNSTFALVGTATEDASTLFETYSGLLSAGTYYAEISSFGGHNEVSPGLDPAVYYDMGGYFLTGSGMLAAVPGDFNGNGVVDAADYVVWRNGLGTTYTQSDYNTWRSHFGQTAGSGAGANATAAVPEPATLTLVIFAVAGSYCRRRRAG